MKNEPETKHVRPRKPAELEAIEKRFADLAAKFRQMRLEMLAAEMPDVTLALGTITHFLTQIEPKVDEMQGKFAAQKRKADAVLAAKREREAIASGQKKPPRVKL